MNKPEADIELSVELVRDLLLAQHPDLSELPITEVAAGWDNAIFRLGEGLAVRLPRRSTAAHLLENEQRWLPYLEARLSLCVPKPLRIGLAQKSYPWRWSVTRWIAGETADRSLPGRDQAPVLATFFSELHTSAPNDAPHNPYRSVPLAQRNATFLRCIASLDRRGVRVDDRLHQLWSDAVARPVDVSPTWIHGDLHPHNVLVSKGDIVAVIDWGDLAKGDRAADLAAVWMLFADMESRDAVMAACETVSENTWQRARGWALLVSLAILEARDESLTGMAEQTMQRLLAAKP